MLRALISDFGGVLMRTHTDRTRRELERRVGLKANTIEDLVFSSDLSQRAQRGEISEEDFWRQLERELDLPHSGLTQMEFRHEFFADDFLDEDLVALIRGVRPVLKTGLISNAWSGLRRLLQTSVPIQDVFDAIVISAEEKVLKPAPRIYVAALDRLGVRPPEAIFLDDVKVNVDAANTLGLTGVHFQSSMQAQRDIRALLDGR